LCDHEGGEDGAQGRKKKKANMEKEKEEQGGEGSEGGDLKFADERIATLRITPGRGGVGFIRKYEK